MKTLFRAMFKPLLAPLEAGQDAFIYKPSHRVILLVMSGMFLGLASLVYWLMPGWSSGYGLPILVFGGAGMLGFVVGTLGEDRAVAKIWGSR